MRGAIHVVGACSIDFSFAFSLPPIIVAAPQETQESIALTSPDCISSTRDLSGSHLIHPMRPCKNCLLSSANYRGSTNHIHYERTNKTALLIPLPHRQELRFAPSKIYILSPSSDNSTSTYIKQTTCFSVTCD